MDLYFRRSTNKHADKAKAKRLKKKRELVVLKNKNLNLADPDVQVTHHLMDVGESYYDKIKRKVGPIEWYKNPAQFQTFTKVDLTILSNSPYVDDKPGGRGYIFFERLKREVARGFSFYAHYRIHCDTCSMS
ncbi:hypothetical protein Hanom_Chr04g00339631 [Helianthus anomalus]